jgi:hypothetical protein
MKTKLISYSLGMALGFSGFIAARAQQVPQPKSADDIASTLHDTVNTRIGKLEFEHGFPANRQTAGWTARTPIAYAFPPTRQPRTSGPSLPTTGRRATQRPLMRHCHFGQY